jgi:hypothetical protein
MEENLVVEQIKAIMQEPPIEAKIPEEKSMRLSIEELLLAIDNLHASQSEDLQLAVMNAWEAFKQEEIQGPTEWLEFALDRTSFVIHADMHRNEFIQLSASLFLPLLMRTVN